MLCRKTSNCCYTLKGVWLTLESAMFRRICINNCEYRMFVI